MKIIAVVGLGACLSGCGAGFFSASTKASYHVLDGTHDTDLKYESNKDQQGFNAEYDPTTKKISVKVDSSKTSEAAIAASAEALAVMAKSMSNLLDKLAPLLERAAGIAAKGGM